MNYIPLIKLGIDELANESPDLSFGELLYSILRKPILTVKPNEGNLTWLRDVKDEEFYTAIQRAVKNEKEHKSI